MESSKPTNTPRIILGLLAFCAATALTVIEIESIKELKRGLMLAIIVFNYAGVAIFWIAGDLKKKRDKYGTEAFVMSIVIRVITFLYIAWMGKTDIVSIHEAGQMFATNLLLLFMEIMMNRYSDGSQQHKDELKQMLKQANAHETYANECECKMNEAQSALNVIEGKLSANEGKLKEYEAQANAAIEQANEIQCKLNACSDKVNAYEGIKGFLESNIDTVIWLGNTAYWHSSKSGLHTWGRIKQVIEVDGVKMKRPKPKK